MKKTIFLFIIFLLLFVHLLHADLLEVYKRGEITLEPDAAFAKNANWQDLFYDYQKKSAVSGKPIGHIKHLAISDDGTIFISNYSRLNLFMFDMKGNFIKTFGEKGRKMSSSSPINRRPELSSVLDNKYIIVNEYQGRIGLYDMEGKLVKLMKMEYPVWDSVALKNNRIAVVGIVPYPGRVMKHVVMIKDINTEKEKQVAFFMEDLEKSTITVKKNGGMIGFGSPFSRNEYFIRRSQEGNLIVGSTNTPKVAIYSPEGQQLKSFTLSAQPVKISEKEKQEYLNGLRKSIEKHRLPMSLLEEAKSKPGFFPEFTRRYYQMLVDSDGNILVFIYTKEEKKHIFQVYSPNGKYICDTVINPGKYHVRINTRVKNMVFYKGDLYGLFQLKESQGVPLRLIKIKLANHR